MPVWMSVKPRYADLILDGLKTVEVRRWLPTTVANEDTCVVYASSPTKAVLGEVRIEGIRRVRVDDNLDELAAAARASPRELREYLDGRDHAYLIELSNPKRYPEPVPLRELKRIVRRELDREFHPNPLFRIDYELLNAVRSAAGLRVSL